MSTKKITKKTVAKPKAKKTVAKSKAKKTVAKSKVKRTNEHSKKWFKTKLSADKQAKKYNKEVLKIKDDIYYVGTKSEIAKIKKNIEKHLFVSARDLATPTEQPYGKRVSRKSGKTYYETRPEKTDVDIKIGTKRI